MYFLSFLITESCGASTRHGSAADLRVFGTGEGGQHLAAALWVYGVGASIQQAMRHAASKPQAHGTWLRY